MRPRPLLDRLGADLPPTFWWLLWSLGEIACVPVAGALVADLSPAHLRGRYQGLFGLSWGGAMLLAPALGGAVLERLGAAALWLGCLGTASAVGLAHLALAASRRLRR